MGRTRSRRLLPPIHPSIIQDPSRSDPLRRLDTSLRLLYAVTHPPPHAQLYVAHHHLSDCHRFTFPRSDIGVERPSCEMRLMHILGILTGDARIVLPGEGFSVLDCFPACAANKKEIQGHVESKVSAVSHKQPFLQFIYKFLKVLSRHRSLCQGLPVTDNSASFLPAASGLVSLSWHIH